MSTRMLIDTRHSEETRVAVVKGSRVEEFDYESVSKKQLKGNIYLARVTRVEPSLQACFVEYGGNRHGFLAFSEIHPDYYQIPAEDREALLAEGEDYADSYQADYDSDFDDDEDDTDESDTSADLDSESDDLDGDNISEVDDMEDDEPEVIENDALPLDDDSDDSDDSDDNGEDDEPKTMAEDANDDAELTADLPADSDKGDADDAEEAEAGVVEVETETEAESLNEDEGTSEEDKERDANEARELRKRRYFLRTVKRRYKIQEVIKRRQVLLIQVVKEERGNKGAALTTYLSLAGRFCVLMPNSTHSGGISRKISSHNDRRRLKGIITSLRLPSDMGLIVRTAGMKRDKMDIKRDYDYLLRMWNAIRDLTLRSMAPALIYEEGNLIKRAIRDLYNRDIDEILVEGRGFRQAKDFMKMLMPSHAAKVKHYQNRIPLFHRYQVEGQLASMYDPVVQLKSGGYVVINPTEALISIDVNSGRATKEKSIEETAVKTNLEAAEEVARQLRLRDMAGLVVIDFIDMEDRNNIRSVERRMKDVLRHDRARIQVGKISSFGLMEMSRQRLRPNLLEAAMHECSHCKGAGVVPTVESAALTVLRELEEEGIRGRSSVVRISLQSEVAAYILNNKRRQLSDLEYLYKFRIEVISRSDFGPSQIDIEREAAKIDEKPQQVTADELVSPVSFEMDIEEDTAEETPEADSAKSPEKSDDTDKEDKPKRRRRRRRRRGRDRDETISDDSESSDDDADDTGSDDSASEDNDETSDDDDKPNRRRRGRRGGRRRRRDDQKDQTTEAVEGETASADTSDNTSEASEAAPVDAPADQQESKPKRRRTRKKAAEAAEEQSAEASADAPEAVTADAPEPAAEEKPKKRTRAKKADSKDGEKKAKSASAKKPAKKKADKALKTEETSKVEAPVAEEPKSEKKAPAPKAEKTEPAPVMAEAPTPSSESSGDDDQPKRKGWWQRTFG